MRDTLFDEHSSDLDSFVFDQRVSAVFPDMIRRSVPGYSTAVAMTGVIAADTAAALNPADKKQSEEELRAYDLGCSLGASMIAMGKLLPENMTLVGVDAAEPMIAGCKTACAELPQAVELVCAKVQDVDINKAAVVVLNYTLQFVPPAARQALIDKIYQGLRPGGVLVLSEKLRFTDSAEQRRMTALHEAFKRENGYSELEIAQKRSALEDVLIADTENQHVERLQQAGFTAVGRWYQCLNFASFIATK